MALVIYEPVKADKNAFIEFWAARYQFTDEAFYKANINQELTEDRIRAWFAWKNGMPLSPLKLASVERNFVLRRGELDQIPMDESRCDSLNRFNDVAATWRIFWLHCWQPDRFPIYDQHVYRAMVFIQSGEIREISNSDREKINSYLNDYVPFHQGFDVLDQREVDKALWAYGKFLGDNNFPQPTD